MLSHSIAANTLPIGSAPSSSMKSLHDRINLWLDSVIREPDVFCRVSSPEDPGQQRRQGELGSTKTKRKGTRPSNLPSPPASLKRPAMDNPQTQTPKKRRLDEHVADTERTPRPGDSVSVTGSDIPSLSSCSESVASGQVSPTRLADQLRHQDKGVLIRTMDVSDSDMPISLREFIPSIQMIATGLHIVPSDLEVWNNQA